MGKKGRAETRVRIMGIGWLLLSLLPLAIMPSLGGPEEEAEPDPVDESTGAEVLQPFIVDDLLNSLDPLDPSTTLSPENVDDTQTSGTDEVEPQQPNIEDDTLPDASQQEQSARADGAFDLPGTGADMIHNMFTEEDLLNDDTDEEGEGEVELTYGVERVRLFDPYRDMIDLPVELAGDLHVEPSEDGEDGEVWAGDKLIMVLVGAPEATLSNIALV